jgi:excisionase family DNA binding protein
MRTAQFNSAKELSENRIAGNSPQNLNSEIGNEIQAEKWLTTKEAAEYLRISAGSLRNMIANGSMKISGKLGTRNRFLQSDLKKLLLAIKQEE